MSGSPTFPRLSEQALEEHQQINFHLDLLSRAIQALDPNTADAEGLANLAARIESLRDRLEEHFAMESDGGLFRAIVDAMPQVESDIRRMQAQHQQIGEGLRDARQLALRREPADVVTLRTDLERVIRSIREHEQEEEALVRRALQQE